MSGQLLKMKIKALDQDGKATEDPDYIYEALVNPETYTINYEVEYNDPEMQPPATSGTELQHVRSRPPTLQFDFLFDGTGVVPKQLEGLAGALGGVPIAGAIASALSDTPKYDVVEDIKKFRDIVYEFEGKSHAPRKVQLIWGTLLFEGFLTSLKINYKLFKPNGTPLRAVATATFNGSITEELRVNKEKKNSPDLTHIREVMDGDRLPLMTHNIYGDAELYMQVAQFNIQD
jgi:hypothetical protein